MTAVYTAPDAMLPRSTAATATGILTDAAADLAILSVACTPRSLAVACGRCPWDVRCRRNLLDKIQRHLGVDMAVWVDRSADPAGSNRLLLPLHGTVLPTHQQDPVQDGFQCQAFSQLEFLFVQIFIFQQHFSI
jgi:hypothetical protein